MASERFNKIAAIWRSHGERIMLGVLLVVFGVGVMYAIQVKGMGHYEIIKKITEREGPGGRGPHNGALNPEQVFETIDAKVDRQTYLNIPTRNVFRTPAEREALADKLVAAYKAGIEFFDAQRYKAAVDKFQEVLTDDPEQVLADYGQGNPGEKLHQARTSLKIEELAGVMDQAKQEWQRAQDFEARNQPISSANTYARAVQLYQQYATEGQGLVAEDGLTQARTRVEEGTRKANALLSTNLTRDVRDKVAALSAQLGSATMSLQAMAQVHQLVTEIQAARQQYSEHIQDDVERQAAAVVNQATAATGRNAVGLYEQSVRTIQQAGQAGDANQLSAGIARLKTLRAVQPGLPNIDRILGQSEQFLLQLQRTQINQQLDTELARLRTGVDQLANFKRNENWSQYESTRSALLANKQQMLELANKIGDRNRLGALGALYQNIETQPAPKEIDFVQIDGFLGNGVYLKDTLTGNRSPVALKRGGTWLASQPNPPSHSMQVLDVNAQAGTVRLKCLEAGKYRETTLKK